MQALKPFSVFSLVGLPHRKQERSSYASQRLRLRQAHMTVVAPMTS